MAHTELAKPEFSPREEQDERVYYGDQQPSLQRRRAKDGHRPYLDLELHHPEHLSPPDKYLGQLNGYYPPPPHHSHPPPSHHFPVRGAFHIIQNISQLLTVIQEIHRTVFPHHFHGPRDLLPPPQAIQPPTNRFVPHYPYPNYHAPVAAAPAPRRRAAIACKHCRKRKVCPSAMNGEESPY